MVAMAASSGRSGSAVVMGFKIGIQKLSHNGRPCFLTINLCIFVTLLYLGCMHFKYGARTHLKSLIYIYIYRSVSDDTLKYPFYW